MADAASLLWRSLLRGAINGANGGPAALRQFDAQGGYETAHVTAFNDMHMLLCLAVADPPAARGRPLASMRRRARFARLGRWARRAWRRVLSGFKGSAAESTNVKVLADVGLAVGEAILAFAEGNYGKAVALLRESQPRWTAIGGSHAERDVLALTLIEACLREGTDLPVARQLLAERASVKDPRNEEGTWDRLREVVGAAASVGGRGKGKGKGEG